jgi:hypothetical protein
MPPTPEEIQHRADVDRLRAELRARETPDLIWELGENADRGEAEPRSTPK